MNYIQKIIELEDHIRELTLANMELRDALAHERAISEAKQRVLDIVNAYLVMLPSSVDVSIHAPRVGSDLQIT